MKKLNGVVIGPSGIGSAHVRELINYGFKNIGLLGRKFRKEKMGDAIISYRIK